jgi:hypothetical protein
MSKIVIEISGGIVVDIHGIPRYTEVHIVDWDISKCSSNQTMLMNANLPDEYIKMLDAGEDVQYIVSEFIKSI